MNLMFLAENAVANAVSSVSGSSAQGAGDVSKEAGFWETIGEFFNKNGLYLLAFLGIIAFMFLIAFGIEKISERKNLSGKKEKFFTTRKIAVVGVLSAMAAVLMVFDFPLWFVPSFYKLDFSEIPVLIGSFAFGPATGVVLEFLKILIKLLIKGTSTAFVGELANFVVGCSFIIPAASIYAFKKTKKTAVLSCVTGTAVMVVFASFFNAIYLLPAFSELYHMPLADILAKGQEKNSLINPDSLTSFVILAVAPLNLIKGVAVSVITVLIYKPLSRFIKNDRGTTKRREKSGKTESQNV